MDFLEDLFDFSGKRRKGQGFFNRDDDRDGHDDHGDFHRVSLVGKECPRCRIRANPGARFCDECGQALPENARVYCRACGHIQQAESSYCPDCGTKL